MLTIHAHQLQRLDAHFEAELISQIRDHIHDQFPDEYAQLIAPDRQNSVIRQAIKAGHYYSLTTDANLTIFTDFRLIFGPTFPLDDPWALTILANDDLSEDAKTEQLIACLDSFIAEDNQ
ncbi:hypothetical protein [Fibrella arboris]|uniref:hypothetical protein n=1 Tax=Fibrella arboris TaxID=3242486 RepID=UPI003520CF79